MRHISAISLCSLIVLLGCGRQGAAGSALKVPLWDYRSEVEFRADVTNPAADDLHDLKPHENINEPLNRKVGLYRYRVRSYPFGFWTLGEPGAPWLSVQDPPKSVIVIDNFVPPIRAIGVHAFVVDSARMPGAHHMQIAVYTRRGSVWRWVRWSNVQSFFGVQSPKEPITAISIEVEQRNVADKYPVLRGVVLGSAKADAKPKIWR